MRLVFKVRGQMLVGAMACCFLAGCSGDAHTKELKFFKKGIAYLKDGKSDRAAIQFLNVLKVNPQNAEAANILAEIEFRRHNYSQAVALLKQAVTVKPDYISAHRGLGHIYRLAGKPAEAQKEFAAILEHAPDDIDALLNIGIAEQAQKQNTDAEGAFNHILELQPGHVGALIALASLKESTGDRPAAERYLRLATEHNPRSVQAQLEFIRFSIASHHPEEAEQLFMRALQATSNNVAILDAQAGFYEGLGKYPEAAAVIRRVQASHPADSRYWRSLADFYVRRNDWAAAEAELNHILQQHPNDMDSMHQLIEVHLNLNDRKTAETLVSNLLKKQPEDTYAHLFRGRMYLADGNVDKALLEFSETAHYKPDSPVLHYWLAQAHIRRNEIQQAKLELEAALRYDAGYDLARLELTRLDNSTGVFDRALNNAMTLVEKRPDNMDAMLAYGDALIGKRDFGRAKDVTTILLKRFPDNSDAHRLRGIVFLADKNLSAAREEFRKAWDIQPGSKLLLESVIAGYFVVNQKQAATEFLQKEIASHPGEALLYQELGTLYARDGDLPEATSAFKKAFDLAPADSDTAISLAAAYARQNRAADAASLVSETIRKHSTDAGLILRAAMILETLGKWDDATKAYSSVLQIDSDNALAKNNLAWVLAEHGGNIDTALALAQQAKEKLNDNLNVTDTVGWVYYKKGLYQMAEQYLKQCATADRNNATVEYQFGMVEWKLGKHDEARRLLKNALAIDPRFADAPSAKAALAQL